MKKIKVLHIGLSPNIGGLESFVYTLYKNIDKTKFEFDFLNIYDKKLAYEDEYKKMGSKVYYACSRKKNPIKSFKQIKEIISKNNFDFIHYHCMTYCWPDPIIIGCKYSKAQVIVHSHNTSFSSDSSLKEKILHKVGKIRIKKLKFLKVACGEEAGKWLFKDNFIIFNNGINFEKFKFNNYYRKKIRRQYNIKEQDIVIGHVGNFSTQKNYKFLLQCFNELKKINKNYKLLLIGDDSKAKKEKDYLNENNLSQNTIFTGIVSNSNEYYSAMDLFIFPSIREGFSIAMIEAQCAGLLCFASNHLDKDTNVGGNYEVINIDDSPINVAQYINKKFKQNYNRNINIDSKYSCKESAKIIEQYYINNCKGENK